MRSDSLGSKNCVTLESTSSSLRYLLRAFVNVLLFRLGNTEYARLLHCIVAA